MFKNHDNYLVATYSFSAAKTSLLYLPTGKGKDEKLNIMIQKKICL